MSEEPLRVSALQLASDKQLIDELCARTSGDPQRVFISMFVRPSDSVPGAVDAWTTTKANDAAHLRVALVRLLVAVGMHEAVANAVLPAYELKQSNEVRVTHQHLLVLLGILGQTQLGGTQAILPMTKASEDMINRFTADAQLRALPATNLAVYVDKDGRIRLTVQPTQALMITETPVQPQGPL